MNWKTASRKPPSSSPKKSFLPYATPFIPLSCICASLSGDIDNASIKKKILHWYWYGVFGELYGGANEARFSQDLPDVVA